MKAMTLQRRSSVGYLRPDLYTQAVSKCDKRMAALQQRIAVIQQASRSAGAVVNVLRGLQTGWRQVDPGKNDLAAWFLGQDGKQAVVREFLPARIKIIKTEEGWNRHLEHSKRILGHKFYWSTRQYNAVGPTFQAISLEEALHHKCPSCGKNHPVIETYAQVGDGPEGDTWLKERLVLCSSKKTLFRIVGTETRDHRF